ncbi:hypothetical protein ACLMAB_03060 [Brevibacillus laterosporus]
MSDYVKVGKDGLVHVDPAAKEIVGKEVYEVYVNGAASVNSAIESGDIKVKDGELSVDKKIYLPLLKRIRKLRHLDLSETTTGGDMHLL